jgi:hypothetical protein
VSDRFETIPAIFHDPVPIGPAFIPAIPLSHEFRKLRSWDETVGLLNPFDVESAIGSIPGKSLENDDLFLAITVHITVVDFVANTEVQPCFQALHHLSSEDLVESFDVVVIEPDVDVPFEDNNPAGTRVKGVSRDLIE